MMVLLLPFLYGCTNDRTLGDPKTDMKGSGDIGKMDSDADLPDMEKGLPQTTCQPACENGKVCKSDDLTCVDCLTNDQCPDAFCNSATNLCVDCLENTTCTIPTASTCQDGACAQCSNDSDCTHIEGLPRCEAGTCTVECESNDDCTRGICDQRPLTKNRCIEGPRDKGPCEVCTDDSDCKPDYLCNDYLAGSFCFKKVASSCGAPYSISSEGKSKNGVLARVCKPLQGIACDTLLANVKKKECMNDSQCPNKGVCPPTLNYCSYLCDPDNAGGDICNRGCDKAGYCL